MSVLNHVIARLIQLHDCVRVRLNFRLKRLMLLDFGLQARTRSFQHCLGFLHVAIIFSYSHASRASELLEIGLIFLLLRNDIEESWVEKVV